MVLPKLGGSDAYTKMYAAKLSLAVVFTTGYSTDAGLLSSAVEKGLAVLQKPYSPDMLGRKVRETLDRVKGEVRYPANVLL